jgi:hypothetical protein
MRRLLIVLVAGLLAACQPTPDPSPQPPTPVEPIETESTVGFSRDGLTISIPKPSGWESFTTEYGVVIAEQFGTVADQGTLQGLMAYVFVTPIDDLSSPVDDLPDNRARRVLRQIVADASFVGAARVTDPTAFTWGAYEAAYYLLTDTESQLKTVVIGLAIPGQESLVIGTLSAPDDQALTLRQALTELFGALTVNGAPLHSGDLTALPDPLDFP